MIKRKFQIRISSRKKNPQNNRANKNAEQVKHKNKADQKHETYKYT